MRLMNKSPIVPSLSLHLGVHKTATTHLQSRLFNSIAKLDDKGVLYLGLNKTRKIVTSRLSEGSDFTSELRDICKSYSSLVISDENILGGTQKPSNNILYPTGSQRAKLLIDSVKPDNLKVYLVVRDPESYFISRYSEYLRHYKYLSFYEYMENIDLKTFSWIPIVEQLKKSLNTDIVVKDFDSVIVNDNEFLKEITGVNIEFNPATKLSSVTRSKISLESYRILEHLADHYPLHMTKKLVNMMDNNKQKGKATPFKPFGNEISEQLKKNYEQDKMELGLL